MIPTSHPGPWHRLGDLSLDTTGVPDALDVGDRSHCVARAKPILRLHPALVSAWPDTLPARQDALALLEDLERRYEEDPEEIEKKGGRVVGAIGLTGKPYSAKLSVAKEQLHELRQRHGPNFEKWWREHFGHAFDCLTQSEARYLARSPDVDTIRDRLAAAMREGGGRGFARSPREQRSHVGDLKTELAERSPDGEPRRPARPAIGLWQGYARPRQAERGATTVHSVFDPRIVVLAIRGRRVSLPATLKLTVALRGLLMRECHLQPPPEWFSGHRRDGKPAVSPHMALAPLPFVGAPHADGRIMGLALILPRELNPDEAGRGLDSMARDVFEGMGCADPWTRGDGARPDERMSRTLRAVGWRSVQVT